MLLLKQRFETAISLMGSMDALSQGFPNWALQTPRGMGHYNRKDQTLVRLSIIVTDNCRSALTKINLYVFAIVNCCVTLTIASHLAFVT